MTLNRYNARDRNIVNKVMAYHDNLPRYIEICMDHPEQRLAMDYNAHEILNKPKNEPHGNPIRPNTEKSHGGGDTKISYQPPTPTNGKPHQGSLF